MLNFLKKLVGGGTPATPPAAAPPAPAAPPPPAVDLSRAGQLVDTAGVDWNAAGQESFVADVLAPSCTQAFLNLLITEPFRGNPFCSPLDAAVIFAIVNKFEPTRLMEVGSGFSTVAFRHALGVKNLPGELIAIDPEPRTDIVELVDAHLKSRIEDVPVSDFQHLQDGELAFFDATHRGADSAYILREILPALNPGVFVGFHGVALPREYAAAELRAGWTEQHGLLEFLRKSGKAEIFYAGNWLRESHPEVLAKLPPALHDSPTSAIWFRIRRT